MNFTEMYLNLGPIKYGNYTEALMAGAPVIAYGQFVTDFIAFVLLAFAVFVVIKKVLASMNKKEVEDPAAPPKQELLLEEIRDLLKKRG